MKTQTIVYGWSAGCLLVVGTLFALTFKSDSQIVTYDLAKSAKDSLRTSDSQLEQAVYQVAAKFICSCGECGGKPLETCDCETAHQERAFIRQVLQSGKSEQEAVQALNEKYGWMKTDPQTPSAVATLAQDSQAKLANAIRDAQSLATHSASGSRLATPRDRAHIISRFKCPCGQCQIDELKDCECQHLKGAIEVKGFIDDTIEEGKYGAAEIVALVDARYGGKIR